MKKLAILVGLTTLFVLGCSSTAFPAFLNATPTTKPTVEPTTTAIRGIFCPTDNPEAAQNFDQGLAHLRQDDWDGAEKLFLKAVELDAGFCDAMDSLGGVSLHRQDSETAIYWYGKSVEANPGDMMAHLNLGWSYYAAGKTYEAAVQFTILTHEKPNNPEGFYGLGILYAETSQPDDAILNLEEAERLYTASNSDSQYTAYIADTRAYLGSAYFQKNDCLKANDYLVRSYNLEKDKPWVNYILGTCYQMEPSIQDLTLAKTYLLKAQELGFDLPAEQKAFINK